MTRYLSGIKEGQEPATEHIFKTTTTRPQRPQRISKRRTTMHHTMHLQVSLHHSRVKPSGTADAFLAAFRNLVGASMLFENARKMQANAADENFCSMQFAHAGAPQSPITATAGIIVVYNAPQACGFLHEAIPGGLGAEALFKHHRSFSSAVPRATAAKRPHSLCPR